MLYTKNNFKDGAVLTAAQLNHTEIEVLGHTLVMAETLRQVAKLATFPLYKIAGNIGIIGDSTISGYPKYPALATYLSVTSGHSITDISTPGDTLVGQLSKWNEISATTKQGLNYVFCQIGLNDTDETKETFRSQYKELIAKIRADAPNAKLILGTMVPGLGRYEDLYGDTPEVVKSRQENWEAANKDIKSGYYDCDAVAFLHTEALGLDKRLRPEYDHGDGIHENVEGAKIVVYSWCATAFHN